MKLVVKSKSQYSGDQGIRVKSLQDTKSYFGVIHGSKCKANAEQICIVDSCNLNLRNVTQHIKRLKPTERLTTTDM